MAGEVSAVPFRHPFELATLNGTNGSAITAKFGTGDAGFSVSRAGDVNADGIEDVIVGADLAYPNGKQFAGQSYVVFGSDQGFPSQLEVAALDGANGFALNGISDSDFSGSSVSAAGDVNADGIDDLIIGAPEASCVDCHLDGQSYVVFGRGPPVLAISGVCPGEVSVTVSRATPDGLRMSCEPKESIRDQITRTFFGSAGSRSIIN